MLSHIISLTLPNASRGRGPRIELPEALVHGHTHTQMHTQVVLYFPNPFENESLDGSWTGRGPDASVPIVCGNLSLLA